MVCLFEMEEMGIDVIKRKIVKTNNCFLSIGLYTQFRLSIHDVCVVEVPPFDYTDNVIHSRLFNSTIQ